MTISPTDPQQSTHCCY